MRQRVWSNIGLPVGETNMRSTPAGRTPVAAARADSDTASCSISHPGIGIVRMPLSVFGPLTTISPFTHSWVSLTVRVRRGQSMSQTRRPTARTVAGPASTSDVVPHRCPWAVAWASAEPGGEPLWLNAAQVVGDAIYDDVDGAPVAVGVTGFDPVCGQLEGPIVLGTSDGLGEAVERRHGCLGQVDGIGFVDHDQLLPRHRAGCALPVVVDEVDDAAASVVVDRHDVADVVSGHGREPGDQSRGGSARRRHVRSRPATSPGRRIRPRRRTRRPRAPLARSTSSDTGRAEATALTGAASGSLVVTSDLLPEMCMRATRSCSGS